MNWHGFVLTAVTVNRIIGNGEEHEANETLSNLVDVIEVNKRSMLE